MQLRLSPPTHSATVDWRATSPVALSRLSKASGRILPRYAANICGLFTAILVAAAIPLQVPGNELAPAGPAGIPTDSQQQVDTGPSDQIPSSPSVSYPVVARPPIPPPLQHLQLPPVQSSTRASAAWRVTALNLSMGRKIDRPSAVRIFDGVYGDVLLALLSACWRSGLKVEALNSNAGEILTTLPNSNIKIVITLTEIENAKTRVAAGCHAGTGEPARTTIDTLLQNCALTLTRQERI